MDNQGQARLHVSYPKYKEGEATVREARVASNYGQFLLNEPHRSNVYSRYEGTLHFFAFKKVKYY